MPLAIGPVSPQLEGIGRPMAVLLNPGSSRKSPETWLTAFRTELPDMEFRLWPDAGVPEEVEFVVAMHHSQRDLHRYPNLRAVLALGAGVDQYTGPDMPDVAVVRLADPAMHDEMAGYVVHWVVHFQKRMDFHLESQRTAAWRPVRYTPADQYRIAILGFGEIGSRIGRALNDLGFPISAWSRTATDEKWVTSYAGEEQLEVCLGSAAAVVNVLPSTDATRRVMSLARFNQCRPGALFINLGRGSTVDESALLDALNTGQIGAAVLDVADPEPMDPSNPLWAHPRARITPHVAGYTRVESATRVIAANIRRIVDGEEPFPLLEHTRSY